jgi:pimeloyl-ACP methyl ester carboxylesterase
MPMPDSIATLEAPTANAPPPHAVRRTAFYLKSQRQWLFAWLHRREQACSDHGVIVCPPLGHEQIHAHRSLRHLADAAARAGFPVLRLDYHGTGDSAGTDEDPDRYATWLANLRDARAWMREQLGCQHITLVGLRLGAALAVQAAAAQAVDDLLLWAPVVKGRAYVRELKALSLTAGDARPSAGASGYIEAAGFVLSAQTADELNRLDLIQSRPRCRRALILSRDDTPADTRLLEHLTALGIDSEQTVGPGYADVMAPPHHNKVPHEAIACAVFWLLAGQTGEAGGGAIPEERVWPAQAVLPCGADDRAPWQTPPQIRERALHITHEPDLFGILSEPGDAPAGPLPVVVLLNAGSCHRVGPNRLYVALSRHLAARGFPCLRLDLCGLGDSVSPDPERENHPYPATTFRDIDLTLKHLQGLGAERVVLLGLCSGAYAGFQSAVRLPSPVLVESVLINPLTFYWKEGMSLDASPAQQLQAYRDCLRSLWQPRKWLNLLAGRNKFGITGALQILLGRRALSERAGQTVVPPAEDAPDVPLAHLEREDLAGDLRRIARAGRQLACFFARGDPGHALLQYSARREVNELCAAGKMSVSFIDGADHTFTRRAARRALVEAITDHLCRRYLPATPLSSSMPD